MVVPLFFLFSFVIAVGRVSSYSDFERWSVPTFSFLGPSKIIISSHAFARNNVVARRIFVSTLFFFHLWSSKRARNGALSFMLICGSMDLLYCKGRLLYCRAGCLPLAALDHSKRGKLLALPRCLRNMWSKRGGSGYHNTRQRQLLTVVVA